MASMGECSVCSDNFVVSSKCLRCGYCQKPFHPQCVKIKDSIHKSIQDINSIFWFCDGCKPVVMDKLTSNLLASDKPVESTSRDDATLVAALRENVENVVSDIFDLKARELQFDSDHLLEQYRELRNEVVALKDSNIDLVRLLTQRRPAGEAVQNVPHTLSTAFPPLAAGNSRPSIGAHSSSQSIPLLNGTSPSTGSCGGSTSNRIVVNSEDPTLTAQQTQNPTASHRSKRNSSEGGHLRQRVACTKGLGGVSDLLRPAPKGRSWIWLGGLSKATTMDNVLAYLRGHFSNSDILVFDLKSKFKKSFKVGSSDISMQDLLNPELWPDGVLVKPFRQYARE